MNQSYASYGKRPSPLKVILLIGGLITAVIVAVIAVFSASGSEPTRQMQQLSARLTTLRAIIDEGSANASGGTLRKINSEASLLLANDTMKLEEALAGAGMGKVAKDVTAAETDSATLEALEEARLNGRFDSEYQRALAQKIESTQALMREIHQKTSKRALKPVLEEVDGHFSGILDQLAQLN